MTGPDYTMYPFSTQNAKDFQNLMSVYMDAVFHPHLRELDFLQEGWRLEHKDPLDPNSPLELKGVVFNEMKGAFSDPGSVLGQHLLNQLLPSSTYRNVSGGDPIKILDLTWEQLKNFHAKHYHPSNSRLYTYGDLSLRHHLKFINDNYLQHFERIALSQEVPNEPHWTESRRSEITCRPDPFAPDPNKQSTAVISYLLSDIGDLYENFVLQILAELLVEGPNAPFYKNLLQANIGMGFSPVSGYDGHTKDTSFTIGLQGIHRDSVQPVLDIITSTFEQVAREGFSAERVEAVLHSVELAIKNQSSSFGLGIIMNATPLWNHGGDLVEALYINAKVDRFRRHLADDPSYLQDKVRRYFVENAHRLVVVMSPDADYEAKLAREEQAEFERKCSALTDDQRGAIVDKGRQLAELQNRSDDASCLPSLQLSDIGERLAPLQLHQERVAGGVPLQVCVQPTNGVTYFRGLLSAAHLSDDLKPHLPLFCLVATQMGAGDMDYRQLDQQMALRTGGLSVGLHLNEGLDSVLSYEQGLVLSSHCLDRNLTHMFELWHSIFNRLVLDDTNRLETLLRNLVGRLVNSVTHMGHQYAMTSAASSLTPTALVKEHNGGMSYIKRVQQLTEARQYEPLLDALRRIAAQLLRTDAMRCAINATGETRAAAVSQLDGLLQRVAGSPDPSAADRVWKTQADFEASTRRTHHVLPVPVNFTSKVMPGVPFLSPDYAPLRILASVMTSKFLHPEIREKGGAYGGGATASAAGLFSFYSYRDPKSLDTIDTFDRAVDWALRSEFTDEAIKEAKLSVFQKVDAPTPPSARGMRLFLSGVSDEQFDEHRRRLIDVSRDDIGRVCEKYLANSSAHGVTVIGPPNQAVAADPSWTTESSNS